MRRFLPILCLLSAALGLLTSGCGRRTTPAEVGVRTQTLLLGNGAEPQSLDPHLVSAYTDQNILLALFEGLCVLDETTSRAGPAAAERWDVSDDGLVYTFHLRPDLRWSNGEPLVAGDFIFAWRRILTPALGAEYAYLLHPLKNAAAFNAGTLTDPAAIGAEALDDRTLRLTLERPTSYLPALTACPAWFPLNPRAVAATGAAGDRANDWTRQHLVGNGPFTFSEWRPNTHVRVTRNLHYWDVAAVRLQGIVFLPTESTETEERTFRAGQVHITSALPLTKLATYREQDPAALRVDPFLQTIFLRFNTAKPPFTDARVRRAFALAIDRPAIARSVLRGAKPPAPHFTPPDLAGYTARARVDADFDQARALLAEAGFPGGAGLPVISLQVRNDGQQPGMAEVLQARWAKELGVQLEIRTLEQKTWVQNQQNLDYMISGAGWIGDFADPVTFLDLFVSHGGNNWTGWKDAAYDELIARAAATTDPAARLEHFQQAEARLLAEAPITPIFWGTRTYLIHPAVQGWEPALLGFHQYKKVYLKNPE